MEEPHERKRRRPFDPISPELAGTASVRRFLKKREVREDPLAFPPDPEDNPAWRNWIDDYAAKFPGNTGGAIRLKEGDTLEEALAKLRKLREPPEED